MRDYARRKYFIGYWKALVTRRHPQRIVNDSHTPQGLKAQIVTVAALTPIAVLSALAIWCPRMRFAWRLAAAGSGLYAALSAPFLAKLAQRSWRLALAGPLLLLVRSIALGSGYLVGTLRFGRGSNWVA